MRNVLEISVALASDDAIVGTLGGVVTLVAGDAGDGLGSTVCATASEVAKPTTIAVHVTSGLATQTRARAAKQTRSHHRSRHRNKFSTGRMSEKIKISSGLYVVATPLGNLGDITARALATLRSVDCIACEDTRVTRDLLRFLDIAPPTLVSVREHNERTAAETIVLRIAAGEAVAYASDAGTPAISDPGGRLVAAVRAAGFQIIPIPGVSAVTAALSAAGLESTAFTFLGFAPVATGGLAEFVASISTRVETSVCFESPHRIEKFLLALAKGLPADRRVVIARELTKKFETITALDAGEIEAWVPLHADKMRGEFVIVVAGAAHATRASSFEARALLKVLLQELPPAKAAKLAAKITGESREALYQLAESLKN